MDKDDVVDMLVQAQTVSQLQEVWREHGVENKGCPGTKRKVGGAFDCLTLHVVLVVVAAMVLAVVVLAFVLAVVAVVVLAFVLAVVAEAAMVVVVGVTEADG